jgi:ABC-type lipoprotein export system ATPase subunit
MEVLKELNVESKTTIVIVTHDAHIASYTHRIIHLRDGVVVED